MSSTLAPLLTVVNAIGTAFGGKLDKIKKKNTFHDNQIKTAEEIVSNYQEGKNYGMLFAQMQCGKTGTSLFVAFRMMHLNLVDNVVIFSGTHDTFLQDQWKTAINDLADEYAKLTGEDCRQHLIDHTHIVWRQNLKKEKARFSSRTLAIWDESHYGSTKKQTIDKQLADVFGDAFRGDTSKIVKDSMYILTVTATRCAELSTQYYNLKARDNWFNCDLIPGDDYFGVENYKKAGLYREANVQTAADVEKIIHDNIDTQNPRIFVIRLSGAGKINRLINEVLFSTSSIRSKIDLEEYNSSNNTDDHYSKLFETKPLKPRVVIVRGLFRMGCVLEKSYLCGVWETSKDPKHNTILQGLPGRVCGYGDFPKNIKVYITSMSSVNEYIKYTRHECGLTHTQHIVKDKTKQSEYTPVTFPIIIRPQDVPSQTSLQSEDSDYCQYDTVYFDSSWNDSNKEEIKQNPPYLWKMLCAVFQKNRSLAPVAEHECEEMNRVITEAAPDDFSFRTSHKENGQIQYGDRFKEVMKKAGKQPCSLLNKFKINLLKITKSYNGYPVGTLIVMITTDRPHKPPVKRTKGTSIHDEIIVSQKTEIDHSNGVAVLEIPKETRENPSAFKECLRRHIQFSKIGGIHSTHNDNITFNEAVFPDGITNIVKELQREMRVKIKASKCRGRRPVGYWRYEKIVWCPK